MSKPFVVKTMVSDRIEMRTTDGSGTVVLDQDDPQNHVRISTDSFSKGILVATDPNTAIQLLNGNIFVFTPNGNVETTSSHSVENSAVNNEQTLLTVTRRVTLDPADPVYDELNNTDVGSINISSRLNIVPDASGTIVNSLIINVGDPNPDGREIWVQNLGTDPGQTLTLTNQSPSGTAGGKFRSAADYVIGSGGGVGIMFDQAADEWLVRGI